MLHYCRGPELGSSTYNEWMAHNCNASSREQDSLFQTTDTQTQMVLLTTSFCSLLIYRHLTWYLTIWQISLWRHQVYLKIPLWWIIFLYLWWLLSLLCLRAILKVTRTFSWDYSVLLEVLGKRMLIWHT